MIPWLVARLKSAGGAKQASIIVLIYFARIERYKSRVVAAGGFDFLSELIRMVRSENVSILRRIPEDALELQKVRVFSLWGFFNSTNRKLGRVHVLGFGLPNGIISKWL